MFELTILLPRDVRHASTLRLLAQQAAHAGGHDAAAAAAFARRVEDAARALLAERRPGPLNAAMIARNGPVIVRLDHQTLTLDNN